MLMDSETGPEAREFGVRGAELEFGFSLLCFASFEFNRFLL